MLFQQLQQVVGKMGGYIMLNAKLYSSFYSDAEKKRPDDFGPLQLINQRTLKGNTHSFGIMFTPPWKE